MRRVLHNQDGPEMLSSSEWFNRFYATVLAKQCAYAGCPNGPLPVRNLVLQLEEVAARELQHAVVGGVGAEIVVRKFTYHIVGLRPMQVLQP